MITVQFGDAKVDTFENEKKSETSSFMSENSIKNERNGFLSESETEKSTTAFESSSDETSNLENSDFLLLDSNKTANSLLLLKNSVYVSGILNIELIFGHAQINGYLLRSNTERQIISAKGYKYSNISVLKGYNSVVNWNLLTCSFPTNGLQKFKKMFDVRCHALLLLTKSKKLSKAKFMKKYLKQYIFPHDILIYPRSNFFSTELLLNTKLIPEVSCKKKNYASSQWSLLQLKKSSKIMIIGGKNVGKSTFAEYMTNKSFNEYNDILFIDLDIGQPMFSVPQTICASVLTEPILGLSILECCPKESKSYLFGDVSPVLYPARYLETVKKLLIYCEKHYSKLPWVINTMGFHKGLGIEMMAALINICKPTILCQLQHQIENFNFKHLITPTFVNSYMFNIFGKEILNETLVSYEMHTIKSLLNNKDNFEKIKQEKDFTSVEKRTINIVKCLSHTSENFEWITDATSLR